MTNPLDACDIQLLKKYGIAIQELQTLPPTMIELTAEQALALVAFLQFAAKGGRNHPLCPSAIVAAKQIQLSFKPESTIFQVLELGWYKPPDFSWTTAIFETPEIND